MKYIKLKVTTYNYYWKSKKGKKFLNLFSKHFYSDNDFNKNVKDYINMLSKEHKVDSKDIQIICADGSNVVAVHPKLDPKLKTEILKDRFNVDDNVYSTIGDKKEEVNQNIIYRYFYKLQNKKKFNFLVSAYDFNKQSFINFLEKQLSLLSRQGKDINALTIVCIKGDYPDTGQFKPISVVGVYPKLTTDIKKTWTVDKNAVEVSSVNVKEGSKKESNPKKGTAYDDIKDLYK